MYLPRTTERAQQVLMLIVDEYIRAATPVGSKTIAQRLNFSLSSATIRNVMGDLEEQGLLEQPHTSAGRVPTPRAVRMYLDGPGQQLHIDESERRQIADFFERAEDQELHAVLLAGAQMLAGATGGASVMLPPQTSDIIYSRIELIQLGRGRILTLFISPLGVVTQKIVAIDQELSPEDLTRASHFLTDQLGGLTLPQIRIKAEELMLHVVELFEGVAQLALTLATRALPITTDSADIVVDGAWRLLDSQHFQDARRLREAIESFEDRAKLLRLMRSALESDGVTIALGEELADPTMRTLSLVATPFMHWGSRVGVVSVVGPTPMHYPKVAALVTLFASHIGELLSARHPAPTTTAGSDVPEHPHGVTTT